MFSLLLKVEKDQVLWQSVIKLQLYTVRSGGVGDDSGIDVDTGIDSG